MAIGFGNAGDISYADWAASYQSVGAFGYSYATADVTAIDAADALLRVKLMSGRPNAKDITCSYFYDPDTTALPSNVTTKGVLTMTHPNNPGGSPRLQDAFLSDWQDGGLIDDEIQIGEVVFVLAGGDAIDDPSAA